MTFCFRVLMHPWSIIAVLFTIQALGATLMILFFEVKFTEIAIPFGLLLLGALTSLFIYRFEKTTSLGRWKWGIPALLHGAVIFFLSARSYSGPELPVSSNFFHPILYTCLGFFLCILGDQFLRVRKAILPLFEISTGMLFALSDELHQSFIPGRTSETGDLILDLLGLLLGFLVFLGVTYVRTFLGECSNESKAKCNIRFPYH